MNSYKPNPECCVYNFPNDTRKEKTFAIKSSDLQNDTKIHKSLEKNNYIIGKIWVNTNSTMPHFPDLREKVGKLKHIKIKQLFPFFCHPCPRIFQGGVEPFHGKQYCTKEKGLTFHFSQFTKLTQSILLFGCYAQTLNVWVCVKHWYNSITDYAHLKKNIPLKHTMNKLSYVLLNISHKNEHTAVQKYTLGTIKIQICPYMLNSH